jgi:hypothetical protein
MPVLIISFQREKIMSDKTVLFIIFGGFLFCILAFGVIFGIIILRGKKHTKKIRMLANMYGFQYEGKELEGVLGDGKDCYPFIYISENDPHVGRIRHRVYHVIKKHAVNDSTVSICDYTLGRRSKGGGWWYYSYTMMLIASPLIRLPDFLCSPPKCIPTLESVPGFEHKVEIPELQDYIIMGKDGNAIRDLLDQSVIDFIKRNPKLVIEGHAGVFLCYYYKGNTNWNFGITEEWEHLVQLEHDCMQLFCR